MASKMAAVDDLTEAQLAHEGMRLLLCSQLKEAETIFSKYRWGKAEVSVLGSRHLPSDHAQFRSTYAPTKRPQIPDYPLLPLLVGASVPDSTLDTASQCSL